MFEDSLNCDAMIDHEKPKDVLPLFTGFIDDAEQRLNNFIASFFSTEITQFVQFLI